MQLKRIKLSELKEHPKNYNRHPESQLKELQRSLDDFEQYKNIVIWKGYIIAGNGLAMAARQRGDEFIYCIERNDLSEKKALALIAADNTTAQLALPDEQSLKELLSEFDDPLDIPGITEDFLKGFDIEQEQDEKEPSVERSEFEIIIYCDSEKQQTELLNRFISEGMRCKAIF